jgi:hypothetical protein
MLASLKALTYCLLACAEADAGSGYGFRGLRLPEGQH